MKSKLKALRKRRGRKPGDGILKEMKPQGSALDNWLKLIWGRYADDPMAQMVLEWWAISEQNEDLAKRAAKLGKTRIAEENFGQGDEEADSYIRAKGVNDRRFEDKRIEFELAARMALTQRDDGWFRKMADIIEKLKDFQTPHPLHAKLMMLGQPDCTVNEQGLQHYSGNAPLSQKARFTIDDLYTILCKPFKLEVYQSKEDAKNIIRRACEEIGFPLLRSKPGPKLSKSRSA